MYPAIITRYAGPTDYTGSRIIASAYTDTPSLRYRTETYSAPYDHAISTSANHRNAAAALLARLNPTLNPARLVAGYARAGYAFVYQD